MNNQPINVVRRFLLLAGPALALPQSGFGADAGARRIEQLVGRRPTDSALVQLAMPAEFKNGYSVPMSLSVASPMTEAEHVRAVQVFAPQNPIPLVAVFAFSPQSGQASVTTRIRLAAPQFIFAVAEMSDGALLMARTWVTVDTNGCE